MSSTSSGDSPTKSSPAPMPPIKGTGSGTFALSKNPLVPYNKSAIPPVTGSCPVGVIEGTSYSFGITASMSIGGKEGSVSLSILLA